MIDLYSRKVVGWSMKPRMATELVFDALTMTVCRRRPKAEVIIHSDQDSQFASGRRHSHLALLSPLAMEQLRTVSRNMSMKAGQVQASFKQAPRKYLPH